MALADDLERAAEFIEENGWQQGDFWPNRGEYKGGPVCLLGALRLCLPEAEEYVTAYRIVLDQASVARGRLSQWNDAEGRTAGEVIDVLRMAAKDARDGR